MELEPTGQLQAKLRAMPSLEAVRLWPKQVTASNNLQASLAQGRPRSLVQMATGSGKTFSACNFA